ncbi:hypothetical protein P5G65_07085 [Paenibacillus chondroitinus]|uniref:Transposase n=1 Tax=Paenibacillus chondroitinus TaxID=59842 RepID=A0ABU6D7C1_9BACL|nr:MULTISPECIES: hypothetical protein [Paenibacillus]MCY9661968.1 hypothetical protein [Paenibacillus anseongense]MEB4793654.1 hypothetical protein [Paenibacillus chondroitinus]
MGRKRSFTISELKYEAGQVKRHIINEYKKGRLSKIIKKDVFLLIARRPKINLKSDRTLWEGEVWTYLDDWYSKLENEVEEIKLTINQQGSIDEATDNHKDLADLIEKNRKQRDLISEYRKALHALREENEKLRILVIEKHGFIDLE